MYFNGTNANLYINGTYVTDALTFEYNESNQKLPIYGYKSVTWDSVLTGNTIIQGNFSINFSDSHDLESYLGAGSLNDTELTPPIKGKAPFRRDLFDIKLIYADKEFVKKDKDGVPMASTARPTIDTGEYSTDPASYWGQKVQQGEYKYKDYFSVIEIKKASVYRAQQAIVADANPLIEFYDFVARSAHISGV